jgi:D-methionine transport system substrate-binding protein
MQFKKILMLFIGFLLLGIQGCSKPENSPDLLVGTIAGPEAELVQVAKEVAKKQYNLNVKVIEFNDYALPNIALHDGSININVFQHQPYLDEAIKNNHYDLVSIGKTFVYPMGIYSKVLKNVKEVPEGAKVAIPNDPSNEARALLLLEKAGLIELKKGTSMCATPLDIEKNPKKLNIKEIDAAQLPRVLNDVALAVINSTYAIPAGLSPEKDAIFLENKDSPYSNLIVVRRADAHNPKFMTFVKAMHSEAVLDKAKELFHDSAIPAWRYTARQ